MLIDEIVFAVSCSATVTNEYELQLTKTGDKHRRRRRGAGNLTNKFFFFIGSQKFGQNAGRIRAKCGKNSGKIWAKTRAKSGREK